jgi:hypothetical protein
MQISLDLHEAITNYNYHTNKGPIILQPSLSESMYDLSYVAPLPGPVPGTDTVHVCFMALDWPGAADGLPLGACAVQVTEWHSEAVVLRLLGLAA